MKKTEYTIDDVAELIGCDRSTVSRQVATLQLGRRIGVRLMLLSAADLKQLQRTISPRPKVKRGGK